MANPSVSIDDELLEDFDHILDVKEMKGELPSDRRSPVIQQLIQDYVDENREDLERWEAFAQGNFRMIATAD